jgi:hypothetical protein
LIERNRADAEPHLSEEVTAGDRFGVFVGEIHRVSTFGQEFVEIQDNICHCRQRGQLRCIRIWRQRAERNRREFGGVGGIAFESLESF